MRTNTENFLSDLTANTVVNSTMINTNGIPNVFDTDKDAEKDKRVNNTSKKSDPVKVCSFYLNKKCRHGREGKECKFSHPKICYTFINKGKEGCDEENCQFSPALIREVCQY